MIKQQPAHPYVFFECCLINYIHKEIGAILSYSIARYASTIQAEDYQIISVAIEMYVDNKLPPDLVALFTAAQVNINPAGDKNALKNNYHLLHNFLSTRGDYLQFIERCRPYFQINQAMSSLGLSANRYEPIFLNHKKIKVIVDNHESRYGKDAIVSVKTEMLLDFRDNNKSYRDFELLKGFLAIKSIQGKKDVVGTNKAFITARMIGAKNTHIVNYLVKDSGIKKLYDRYNERYFFDKLLIELQVKKFITGKHTPKGMRVTYLSTQLQGALFITAISEIIQKQRLNKSVLQQKVEQEQYSKLLDNLLNNS